MNQVQHRRIQLVLPADFSNKKKGDLFERLAKNIFIYQGFDVQSNVRRTGIQTDLILTQLDTGNTYLVECKAWKNDSIKSESLWKIYGQAKNRGHHGIRLVSILDLDGEAKGVFELLHDIDADIISGSNLVDSLEKAYKLNSVHPKLIEFAENRTIYLAITATLDFFWVFEDVHRQTLITQPATKNSRLSSLDSAIRNSDGTWMGYTVSPVSSLTKQDEIKSSSIIDQIIVQEVMGAKSFEDYQRPSHPDYFVGRREILRNCWQYLDAVRAGKELLRILCFPGNTGMGKSSLVVKLVADCKQKRPKFYCYAVDVTSVDSQTAHLFIFKSFVDAIQEACKDGFLPKEFNQCLPETTNPDFVLDQNIQSIFQYLKSHKKVLILFFDQFESVLSRQDLSSLFLRFEELCKAIHKLQSNLVIGFCWRIDIYLPVSHQAYNTWNNLEKIRQEFPVYELNRQDKEKILKFSEKIHKFDSQDVSFAQDWIKETCPNLPWLIRKICSDLKINVDIIREAGDTFGEYNISLMFDNDLQRYAPSKTHRECLKYIAELENPHTVEVIEKFGEEIFTSLRDHKLIITSGQNSKICWDIFRDHILGKKAPSVKVKHIFRNKVDTVLTVFRLTGDYISRDALLQKIKSSSELSILPSTLQNIIQEMVKFLDVTYNRENHVLESRQKLYQASDLDIADHVYNRLRQHSVIDRMRLLKYRNFTDDAFVKVLTEDLNCSPRSAKDYKSKMLSWFLFAGLIEKVPGFNGLYRVCNGDGSHKGIVKQQASQLRLF